MASLKTKALQVIEKICIDDDTVEASLLSSADEEIPQPLAKVLYRKISDIYKYAHAVNPHPCYDVHEDWRQELEELYKKMKEGGIL